MDPVCRRSNGSPAAVRFGAVDRYNRESEYPAGQREIQRSHYRDHAQHGLRLRRRQGKSWSRGSNYSAVGDLAGSSTAQHKRDRHVEHERSGVGDSQYAVISDEKTTLFVVAWHDDGAKGFAYRLHALDLKNGTDRHPPVIIGASSSDATLPCKRQNTFNPCLHKQRTALLLSNGTIYVAFGGDGNRGALFAFDAQTLEQKAFWNSTPTGNDGGIWQSGQG